MNTGGMMQRQQQGGMPRQEHEVHQNEQRAFQGHDEGRPSNGPNNAREYNGHWQNTRTPRQNHEDGYRPPEGYEHRHWGHGDRLPPSYYARNYWISNFLAFGLFAPPPNLVWVRVGDDALLIDQYSGEVVQVDYDVFD
jgi:Ni/Co efflux regulator RcnB